MGWGWALGVTTRPTTQSTAIPNRIAGKVTFIELRSWEWRPIWRILSRRSQLRKHFVWIPITPYSLNLAIHINLEYVDAFELDLFAVRTGAAASPLHRRAMACYEDMVFLQFDFREALADRFKELAQCFTSRGRRRPCRVIGRRKTISS